MVRVMNKDKMAIATRYAETIFIIRDTTSEMIQQLQVQPEKFLEMQKRLLQNMQEYIKASEAMYAIMKEAADKELSDKTV